MKKYMLEKNKPEDLGMKYYGWNNMTGTRNLEQERWSTGKQALS